MSEKPASTSPRWSNTAKLVVALTAVAVFAFMVVRFQVIIGPLMMAFMVAYLLYPVADFFRKKLKFSWRLSVNLIYLVILIVIIALLTWGGFALGEQVGALFNFLQRTIANLPATLDSISTQVITLGPFELDLSNFNLLGDQLFNTLQPTLSKLGSVVGSLASGAASTVGWILFTLLVSYFVLLESSGVQRGMIKLEIPGYESDIQRLGTELGHIWNAFLRGQIILILLITIVYTALLGTMGVRFFYVLALMAGILRFIPYIGPAITWVTYGLVAYLQGSTLFGLQPIWYALLIVALSLVTDAIIDNLVTPRIMASALKVHPAAVMVAAIIGISLLGLVGIILAAPVLATLQLVGGYLVRKMMDLDPWEGIQSMPPPASFSKLLHGFGSWIVKKFKKEKKNHVEPPRTEEQHPGGDG